MSAAVRDRAAVTSTAVVQIVATALRRWNAGDPTALSAARAAVANYLRDEIADIERAVRNEIRTD
jgi:hypothetical protein